jgi:hypothetical protein
MRTGPVDYTEGLGEVVRGYRLYTGLSAKGMADKLGMSVRSYERIENGEVIPRDRNNKTAPCPPGFFDSLEKVVTEFDETVSTMIDNVRKLNVTPMVSAHPDKEWERCIAARAAVESTDVNPVLHRRHAGQPRTRAG